MTKKETEPTFAEVLLEDESRALDFGQASLQNDVTALICNAFQESQMSQADLGRSLSVTRARANQIVSGEATNFTLGLMGRAAAALGLRWRLALDDLKTGEERFTLSTSPLVQKRRTLRVLPRTTWVGSRQGGPTSNLQIISKGSVTEEPSQVRQFSVSPVEFRHTSENQAIAE